MEQLDCYTWVSSERLMEDTRRLLGLIPPDVGAVAGMARSGLIPAAYLAAQLHVPLWSVSESRVVDCGHGWRLNCAVEHGPDSSVLLVDDTVFSGRTMREVLPWLRGMWPGRRIVRAAVYSTGAGLAELDAAAVHLEGPHYLEWNLMNSSVVGKAVTDLDGILCEDCPAPFDDDGDRYAAWLRGVRPRWLPRRTAIPLIVTARLERWRAETEAWLRRWGVAYQRLVMGPWDDLSSRRKVCIGAWKAAQYRESRQALFVESDHVQARIIAAIAHRPVLCPVLGRVLTGGT